jgi:2-oxoglutarate ferredoxin oxidoreductase subunit alpha
MTATSGPGFTLMQEHIGYAAYTEIPCVVVDVMRVGPSTGLPTSPAQGDVMQARWGTHGDHPIIVLTPASVNEVYELTVRAFNLAERFRVPTILLYDEVIGHVRERVQVPAPGTLAVVDRAQPAVPPEQFRPYVADPDGVPPMPPFGTGYRFHVTGLAHDERGYPTQDADAVARLQRRLHAKLETARFEIVSYEGLLLDDAEVAVVAFGISARAARRAVLAARENGLRAGLFRPQTLWPFPDAELRALASRVGALVVAEMNMGQLVYEVERCAAGQARVLPCLRADGQPMSPEDVLSRLLETQGPHSAAALNGRGGAP